MHLLDILNNYKTDFINIGINQSQRDFLHIAFLRWYMITEKMGQDGLFPADNIFNSTYSIDITYANKTKNTNFDIFYLDRTTKELYIRYVNDYQNIIFGEDTCYDADGNGQWTSSNIITTSQYNRLKELYSLKQSDKSKFTQNYNKLINLYSFIEIDKTQHLSLPPIFNGIELFGSCINTHNVEFCSLFQQEILFNSLGSFWDYSFHKNEIYLCNPPFDIHLIKLMAQKLLHDLETTKYEVVIVISIPLWDTASQKMMKIKDFNMGFDGYDILVNNAFLKEKLILDKTIYKYWDYCAENTKAVSHTHLIVLSNIDDLKYKKIFDIEKLTDAWKGFSKSY